MDTRAALLFSLLILPVLQESTCGTASEVCDGRDNDGDGVIDEDLDFDGDGYSDCATAPQPGDCDDSDPTVHPTPLEYPGNEKDDDCDGVESDVVQLAGAMLLPSHWTISGGSGPGAITTWVSSAMALIRIGIPPCRWVGSPA